MLRHRKMLLCYAFFATFLFSKICVAKQIRENTESTKTYGVCSEDSKIQKKQILTKIDDNLTKATISVDDSHTLHDCLYQLKNEKDYTRTVALYFTRLDIEYIKGDDSCHMDKIKIWTDQKTIRSKLICGEEPPIDMSPATKLQIELAPGETLNVDFKTDDIPNGLTYLPYEGFELVMEIYAEQMDAGKTQELVDENSSKKTWIIFLALGVLLLIVVIVITYQCKANIKRRMRIYRDTIEDEGNKTGNNVHMEIINAKHRQEEADRRLEHDKITGKYTEHISFKSTLNPDDNDGIVSPPNNSKNISTRVMTSRNFLTKLGSHSSKTSIATSLNSISSTDTVDTISGLVLKGTKSVDTENMQMFHSVTTKDSIKSHDLDNNSFSSASKITNTEFSIRSSLGNTNQVRLNDENTLKDQSIQQQLAVPSTASKITSGPSMQSYNEDSDDAFEEEKIKPKNQNSKQMLNDSKNTSDTNLKSKVNTEHISLMIGREDYFPVQNESIQKIEDDNYEVLQVLDEKK